MNVTLCSWDVKTGFNKRFALCYTVAMSENKIVHFVGIKGTGMAALVEVMSRQGVRITGSDVSDRFYTDEILEKLGIKVLPFSEKNITDDVGAVIYSSAYSPETNPDLMAAKKKGLPLKLYSEALGELSRSAYSVGVCGVHGKTTTTGLAGTLLKAVNLPSQALAGSVIASFGNSCTMTSDSFAEGKPSYFVAETCEYQRHFLAFSPKKIILTSVESDHQDYYPKYADIRKAFVEYILKLPQRGQLIYCADDSGAVETAGLAKQVRPDIELIPYGENALGNYKLTFLEVSGDMQFFTVGHLGKFALTVPGRHMVRNATSAIALCCELLREEGLEPHEHLSQIREGLLSFTGGKRRSEITGKGKTKGGQDVIFMDDYAHHPTAIRTTLAGYRDFYKKRKIIVDFMSHTYSRTQALLGEFAESFSDADAVIINKIYASAREKQGKIKVTGEILAERTSYQHRNVFFCGEFEEAAKKILSLLEEPSGSEYPDGYLVVTMGAGDNWKVGSLVKEGL